jgi:hypothetical protein
MNPAEILQFVGIPVVVATVIVIVSWWVLPKNRVPPLGATLAVGAASCIAFILQEGIPSIPPMQKWHWLVITVLIISFLACVFPFFKKFDELIVLQAMVAGIIAAVFMQFPSQSELYKRCLVLLMVLFVSVGLRRLTIPLWHMYFVSWLILAGVSILALQSSFAKLAFFAGAMSAVAASMCVLQLLKPRETKSIQMIFGVLIVGCSLCGFSYDQNETVVTLVWFVPMAGVSISAIAYLLLKHHKNRACISLAIVASCITVSTIWSILVSSPTDDMWP